MLLNFKIVRIIFAKELLDVMRDRRTLIALLGVPIVLYPLLFLIMSQAAMLEMRRVEDTPSRVAVVAEDAAIVQTWLSDVPKLVLTESQDPAKDVLDNKLDAIVVADTGSDKKIEEGGAVKLTVEFDATRAASRETVNRIEDALKKVEEAILDERLAKVNLNRDYVWPITMERKDVAPPQKLAGSILGAVLPVIMVVMLGIGAFYPAIDLTAGEKERGTFETLLSTPVSTHDIVWGKFGAVFCLSLLTGALNLGSMLLTFSLQLIQWRDELVKLEISFSFSSVAIIFATIIPLALFISAVMMSLAVCARSFREAQNFVTPFFMLLVLPAFVASLPEVNLTTATRFVPIANVALLFKQLLIGSVPIDAVFVVLLTTTFYAILALVVASWLFQREDIVLNEERGFPITLRRSLFEPRLEPTPGLANLTLCLCFLLLFHVGSYVQAKSTFGGILVTQWLLFALPVIAILLYTRVSLFYTLNLRIPSMLALAGSVVAAAAWIPIVIQLSYLQNKVMPVPEELAKMLEGLFKPEETGVNVPMLLFILALSPAICEELLFRGVVLSAYRNRMPAWAVVLLVGVLFGAAHLSIYRFILTALTGVLLTWLVLRSRSIFCSIAAHFTINAASILISTKSLPASLASHFDPIQLEQTGVPVPVLITAALVVTAGILMVRIGTRDALRSRN